MANEFDIIRRYFSAIGPHSKYTRHGIGDDGAVVSVPPGQQLVVSLDTLVEGRHFDTAADPADIAYKALAVNLSDLAAMAADPAWFLLSLTLPRADEKWLAAFALGLSEAADEYRIQLIGGDTCRGPLAIAIQAAGMVPEGNWVERGGALPGDLVVVSGELGNAALGFAHARAAIELDGATAEKCARALNRPRPRLELVTFLRRFANAAIDISDGLVGDLRHILDASACGADLELAAIPVDSRISQSGNHAAALHGGDDYEICCTVPEHVGVEIERWNLAHPGCPLSVIGRITESGYRLRKDGEWGDIEEGGGYDHFV